MIIKIRHLNYYCLSKSQIQTFLLAAQEDWTSNPRGVAIQQTNLKHILVQQSRPKHRDAVCADVGIKTS